MSRIQNCKSCRHSKHYDSGTGTCYCHFGKRSFYGTFIALAGRSCPNWKGRYNKYKTMAEAKV